MLDETSLEAGEQILLQTLARIDRVAFVSSWPAKQRWIDVALARVKERGLIKEHERSTEDSRHRYSITDVGRAHLATIQP